MTSKLPFEGLTAMQIMKKVCIENALPDMTLVIDGCPEVLTDMMTQCLAQAPGARPSLPCGAAQCVQSCRCTQMSSHPQHAAPQTPLPPAVLAAPTL